MKTKPDRNREKVPVDNPLWAFRTSTETPEQTLEDLWPFFDLTHEERDWESESVCRDAIVQWNSLSPEVRERAEWYDEDQKRNGMEILARWAREYRERRGITS